MALAIGTNPWQQAQPNPLGSGGLGALLQSGLGGLPPGSSVQAAFAFSATSSSGTGAPGGLGSICGDPCGGGLGGGVPNLGAAFPGACGGVPGLGAGLPGAQGPCGGGDAQGGAFQAGFRAGMKASKKKRMMRKLRKMMAMMGQMGGMGGMGAGVPGMGVPGIGQGVPGVQAVAAPGLAMASAGGGRLF